RPTAWHKCHHCGTSFPGRTNRLYCSHRCKRAAERTRNKLSMLGARVLHSLHAEKEALAEGGERYHEVRYIRARRERDLAETNSLLDKSAPKNDPGVIRQIAKLLGKLREFQPALA